MGLFRERPLYVIPGVTGPKVVRSIADVDAILEGLLSASRDRDSEQFKEELDIVLDARLYFMKRG